MHLESDRMRIWLGKGVLPTGRKHVNVGLHIYEDENKKTALILTWPVKHSMKRDVYMCKRRKKEVSGGEYARDA